MPQRFPPAVDETEEQRQIRELIECLEMVEKFAVTWSAARIEAFASSVAEQARRLAFGQIV